MPDAWTVKISGDEIAFSGMPVLLDTGVRQSSVRNNIVVWSKWDDTLERDTIRLAKLRELFP